MAVVVRLRRMGGRNNPFYRVVAADSRTSTNGKFIERLGWYNPNLDGTNFKLNLERVEYWKLKGARFTGTVTSLVKKARNAPAEVAKPPAQATPPVTEPDTTVEDSTVGEDLTHNEEAVVTDKASTTET